jgi:hypothetical protein
MAVDLMGRRRCGERSATVRGNDGTQVLPVLLGRCRASNMFASKATTFVLLPEAGELWCGELTTEPES